MIHVMETFTKSQSLNTFVVGKNEFSFVRAKEDGQPGVDLRKAGHKYTDPSHDSINLSMIDTNLQGLYELMGTELVKEDWIYFY